MTGVLIREGDLDTDTSSQQQQLGQQEGRSRVVLGGTAALLAL